MKLKFLPVMALCVSGMLIASGRGWASEPEAIGEARQPHTPSLIYYLTGISSQKEVDAIGASVQKLKSATVRNINTNQSYACIRFDSHVVSYHQVAQAIADAGDASGIKYNPYLVFCVPEYSRSNNAAKVDAIFAGKRLDTRVSVKPLDVQAGKFAVYFKPLTIVTNATGPQGFNGGHLHHPISDPPPRGLGMPSNYLEADGLQK